ncbi:MAG: FISUMP domain-containing protein [Cryomorphaceae bacterium]|nr:hypothetical protein [Flavobacteriales bacterium]
MKNFKKMGFYSLALALAFTFSSCDEDDSDSEPDVENEDPSTETGTVTDSEGNTYSTVVIGNLEWMSENLRTSSAIGTVECYDEDSDNCGVYGNLYDFTAITQGEDPSNNRLQGICPDGWFLPRRDDFSDMVNFAGSGTYLPDDLKADSDLWFGSGAGNNETGFSALPGGRLNISDDGAGNLTYNFVDITQTASIWWIGHIDNTDQFFAGSFAIPAGGNQFSYGDMNSQSEVINNRATSCRCVKPV